MARKPLLNKAMLDSSEDFEVAYKLHSQSIYRFHFWRTRDRNLSEDLTSIVFEKAWISRSSFQGGSIKSWLYSIARNNLTDYWRKKKDVSSDKMDLVIDEGPSNEAIVDAKFNSERLEKAIKRLSGQMSQVVQMRFINGMSAIEVSKQLNISEGNVRIIQYRALKKLRTYLS